MSSLRLHLMFLTASPSERSLNRRKPMNTGKLILAGALAALCSVTGYVAVAATAKNVPADRALSGVPMAMTPDQLPDQFRTQLRGDVKHSHGTAVLKRKGNDVQYAFNWDGMTSS